MAYTTDSPITSPTNASQVQANQSTAASANAGADSAGTIDPARVGIVFTSDLRRSILDNTPGFNDANSILTAQKKLLGASLPVPSTVTSTTDTQILAALQQRSEQVAAASGTVQDIAGQLNGPAATPYIVMSLNPNSATFTLPQREASQPNQRGTVFYYFSNDKGQNNDIMTIDFHGSTGNIFTRSPNVEDQNRAQKRLQVWHNLLQLTLEPKVLTNGLYNNIYIWYTSALFPQPIQFIGHFNGMLQFSEDAKKPNSRQYSMKFTVHSTTPDFNTTLSMLGPMVTGIASV